MICIECEMKNKGMISGQAFTEYTCKICGHIDVHHNTAVPSYCLECSKKYNICEYCGKEIHGKKK